MSKINKADYTHIMFVDASGDDGFTNLSPSSTGKGSSLCFSAACFLMRIEDESHNIDVLNSIKASVKLKPEIELKHNKFKNYKGVNNSYPLIRNFSGRVFTHTILKNHITKPNYLDTSSRHLSLVPHIFSIHLLIETVLQENPAAKVLIVIDNMKKVETDKLNNFYSDENISKEMLGSNIIFRDSQDKDFSLIQAADLFAGIVKDFFESAEVDSSGFQNLCRICWSKNRAIKCSYKRKHTPYPPLSNLRFMSDLLKSSGTRISHGIFAEPSSHLSNYHFIDCLLG